MTKKKPIADGRKPLGHRLDRIGVLAHDLRNGRLDETDRDWLANALGRIAAGEDPSGALDVKGRKGEARTPAERAKERRIIEVVFEIDSHIDAAGVKVRRGKAYSDALFDACVAVAKKFRVSHTRAREIWDRNPEWRGMDMFAFMEATR